MVTQLSGTEQWVFNLEQGKALQASAQQQSIGQRGMCKCAGVCFCVCVCARVSRQSARSDLCIQHYSLNKHTVLVPLFKHLIKIQYI